ncbi:bicyclomycin resistance protein-1 [Rodentibacter pneumotropicus]|uniref:Bicyclomycin resistance protein-1 n=1 Tax=Rodentibacter pneumotropicus TaxID=758 RepID=A0A3S4VFX5_9PAST|nr:bicyclomycin resistance protein-1 [Rodentibacter pneumotropicus]
MGALSTLLVFLSFPKPTKRKSYSTPLEHYCSKLYEPMETKEVLGYMFAASFGFGGLFALLLPALLCISVFTAFPWINSAISLC